jgi:ubiquinone/menaquinone biosynthesis C-methylase UbiE
MLLNELERLLTNSSPRRWLQRWVEVPWFLRHGQDVAGGYVLELGCGRGVGADLIFDKFGVYRLDAFDLDPLMLGIARQRLASRGERVKLWQGDATAIASPDGRYDAVFDFEVIHHVPDWRKALHEVHRVLRPGGVFFAGEILERAILNPIAARLFDHPVEDRFSHADFCEGLSNTGLRVVAARSLADHAGWYVARKPRFPADAGGTDAGYRGRQR